MKKLLIAAAAVTLALSTTPALMGHAQAAPAKSPFCKLAKSEKNPVAWNAFYGCLGQPRAVRVVEHQRAGRAVSPFCKLAKSEKNPVAWNAYYGCLSH